MVAASFWTPERPPRFAWKSVLAHKNFQPILLVFGLLFGSPMALGQVQSEVMLPLAGSSAPRADERLSDWLLRQPDAPRAYPLGLNWRVPAERSAQDAQKRELLGQIARSDRTVPAGRAYLASMIRALPATGRITVPLAEARWLQANSKSDPLLQPDHVVLLPQRPRTVTTLREDGTWCTIPHQSGGTILDYVGACEPSGSLRVDWAWVVQPNGLIQRSGIASWNRQNQDELAPGAVIWAPSRDSGWPEAVSEKLVDFLATQSYDDILQVARLSKGLAPDALRVDAPFPTVRGRTARDPVLTSNNWGMAGLLQTPSARFAEAGEARFNFNRVFPYQKFNVFLQPFDWFEAGFRYTDIVNRLYGPANLSGDQTYKDKSIDFRLRLTEESAYFPQLAVGMIDLGGTGLFSSEFLVANKRFGNFDWSVGLGWGNLGASGNVRNPFSLIDQRFTTRSINSPQGGTPNTAAFFRGPTAIFGGFQYHTPWDNWLLKVEYDGNDYQSEPLNNRQRQRTPINLGVVYRYHPSLHLSMGVERGNAMMLGLTLRTSVSKLNTPKVSDQPTPRSILARPTQDPLWVATAVDIFSMSGWSVQNISRTESTIRVVLDAVGGVHWGDRIDRIAAVLHRDAPSAIETFELVFTEQGVALSERVIQRQIWASQNTRFDADLRKLSAIAERQPQAIESVSREALWERTAPRFGYGVVPSWQQNIGGPDGFLLFRAGVAFPMRYRITDNIAVSGALSLNLIDNYDNFKYTGPSQLPRVRTYMREYMIESRINIPNLQITHFGQMAPNQYYSFYAGYLESMYGGVGGEWLYRPWHSPIAFGVDINQVQQRDFNQWFGFGNASTQTGYRVATGHATAYWDTGWKSTHVRVQAGRYLAGDIGATLDISRTFANGVSIGAWATRTNVSAERFGEGSFDKGMYLRIPFDVMTTTRSGDAANLVYSPLTRDGGARLNRNFTLYGVTTPRSKRDTSYAPAVN
ncbi:MAG: YjbH domain-containing protein [Betaproteobacteria bacterium]|nr:YjbH domain-containing protein [Betaproteobacteria bacterium]